MHDNYDVIVIGGGPAGSVTAGLLAKQGRSVLVLERDKFPRFHIGESLVPGVLPVLDELGLRDTVDKVGFTRKFGISLLWGQHEEPWTVRFGESGPFDYAYEVNRADFDALLLRHARHLGAVVNEDATVDDVVFEDGRCVGANYTRNRSNEVHEARASLVIDASGQSHLLGRKLGLVEWQEDLKNLAVWAYYQGGAYYPGIDAGNILIENRPDGWLWVIPLSDGTHSVGWVCPSASSDNGGSRGGEMLERQVAESVESKRLLADATRVSGFRTARDWSYTCRRFYGPGFLLVGDAAGFVDPLFSTGVFLAMRGGSLAAQTAGRILDGAGSEGSEDHLGAAYDNCYRAFLDTVMTFVKFFYDASKDKEAYWEHAKTLIDPIGAMTARHDFIRLVSGLNAAPGVMDLSVPPPRAHEVELAAVVA